MGLLRVSFSMLLIPLNTNSKNSHFCFVSSLPLTLQHYSQTSALRALNTRESDSKPGLTRREFWSMATGGNRATALPYRQHVDFETFCFGFCSLHFTTENMFTSNDSVGLLQAGASQLGEISNRPSFCCKIWNRKCKNVTRQQLAQIDFSDWSQVHFY